MREVSVARQRGGSKSRQVTRMSSHASNVRQRVSVDRRGTAGVQRRKTAAGMSKFEAMLCAQRHRGNGTARVARSKSAQRGGKRCVYRTMYSVLNEVRKIMKSPRDCPKVNEAQRTRGVAREAVKSSAR